MKFTKEATNVFASARQIGLLNGSRMISTEHILVALTMIDTPSAEILRNNGITIESLNDVKNVAVYNGDMEFSSMDVEQALRSLRLETRKLLTESVNLSEKVGTGGVIAPEHLLFTMAASSVYSANGLLLRMGADCGAIIDDLNSVFSKMSESGEFFRPDDVSNSVMNQTEEEKTLEMIVVSQRPVRSWMSSVRI